MGFQRNVAGKAIGDNNINRSPSAYHCLQQSHEIFPGIGVHAKSQQRCDSSWPFNSSVPIFRRPIVGSLMPKTVRQKIAPNQLQTGRGFPASHSTLAPRSSITVSPIRVGMSEANGRPVNTGQCLSTNFAIAISAPVFAAENNTGGLALGDRIQG